MSTVNPPTFTPADYESAASAYLQSLPPEHHTEAVAQAKQRKITLESFDVVRVDRPDIQLFNELLVQYPRPDEPRPGQVVPDNMAVRSDAPIEASGSYDVEYQPVGPFLVMEYVSKSNKRKDYEDSFDKYEQELRVPYYLLFYPDTQDLQLYRLAGEKYVSVPANEHGRHAIPELELEVALLDGWLRYWFRGKLVPLTPELVNDLSEARRQLEVERKRAGQAEQRAGQAEQRAEEERKRAEQAEQRAEEERRRAEEERRRAEQAERQAESIQQQRDQERQARLLLEQELQRLRAAGGQGRANASDP